MTFWLVSDFENPTTACCALNAEADHFMGRSHLNPTLHQQRAVRHLGETFR